MIAPVKLIYSPTVLIVGLLTAAMTLLLVQFAVVTFLSQKILTTTQEQYFISSGSSALNKTFIGLLDAETAVRGYALTNDRNYLDPFFGAVTAINSSLIDISVNISNNAEWEKQLQKLIPLIKFKMQYLDDVIRLQDVNDVSSLKVMFAGQSGKKAMESIRLLYGTLDASLRKARANIATINQQNQLYLLWIQAIIDSLLVIIIFIAACLGIRSLKAYKLLNASLKTESTTDTLTNLANRRLFLVWASLALARTTRGETGLAILFIDLNGFKKINDTFGHQAGDDVLKEVSSRLTLSMRSSDFIARIGGDEFAILISGNITKDGLMIFQKNIAEVISAPLPSGAMKGKRVIASIGFAIYPENGTTVKTLLAAADAGMFTNKRMHQTQGLSATEA